MTDYDPLAEFVAESNEARELELITIRNTMSTEHGRRMLWNMIKRTGVFDNSFSSNPYSNAYNNGVRAVGLMIIADLKQASDDFYFSMLKENQ